MNIKEKINGNAGWIRYATVIIFIIGYAMTQSGTNSRQDKAIEVLEGVTGVETQAGHERGETLSAVQQQVSDLKDDVDEVKNDVKEFQKEVKNEFAEQRKKDDEIIQLLYEIKNK